MELYSDANKHDLQMLRFQNLITSVDKLKYFYSKNELNQNPPIFIETPPRLIDVLIARDDSVLLELQESLIKYRCEGLAKTMEQFVGRIGLADSPEEQLFLFRLCCLVVSHKLLFLPGAPFNHELLSDITYFYAFTHTYFSPNEYKSFEADEIVLALSDILGEKGAPNERRERSKKKYSGPFVWGQVVSWYKQTIVCPEASLSQDRRGTLSYPLIKSIMYPSPHAGAATTPTKNRVATTSTRSSSKSPPVAGRPPPAATSPSRTPTSSTAPCFSRTCTVGRNWRADCPGNPCWRAAFSWPTPLSGTNSTFSRPSRPPSATPRPTPPDTPSSTNLASTSTPTSPSAFATPTVSLSANLASASRTRR
jgi:hypothetical protein